MQLYEPSKKVIGVIALLLIGVSLRFAASLLGTR